MIIQGFIPPLILQISGVEPVVPPSAYKSDGTWPYNALEVGQICLNVADEKIWFRSLDGIVEITGGNTYNYYYNTYRTENIYLSASLEELFGIYSVPSCAQSSIIAAVYDDYTTGFGVEPSYSSGHTQPYTSSTIGMISNQKTINIEFDQNIMFNPWGTGFINYEIGFTYPTQATHLLYFSSSTLSSITSIYSSRYYHDVNTRYSKQYMTKYQYGNIQELRIPTGCTSLNNVIIHNEGLSTESVNSILVTLDAIGLSGGTVDLGDFKYMPRNHCLPLFSNSSPCGNGLIAKQKLINKKWKVITN